VIRTCYSQTRIYKAAMSQFAESSLIAAGFLRQRCHEAVDLGCPVCGTPVDRALVVKS